MPKKMYIQQNKIKIIIFLYLSKQWQMWWQQANNAKRRIEPKQQQYNSNNNNNKTNARVYFREKANVIKNKI